LFDINLFLTDHCPGHSDLGCWLLILFRVWFYKWILGAWSFSCSLECIQRWCILGNYSLRRSYTQWTI